MSYRVRYTPAARADLRRLFSYLVKNDIGTAKRARNAIAKGIELLGMFPFSCRKASSDNPFLREIVIPFGASGYVALFEIENEKTVTILAVRHQREDDYY